jgi:hypothetical protein
MGRLDEPAFDALMRAGCSSCGGAALTLRSFLDRSLRVMLGTPNDDGRWAHDGEKFVDGVYDISCPTCAHVVFASDDCPRCHAAGGLRRALGDVSRLVIPKRCPGCQETELLALALAPAEARWGAGPPKPRPLVEFGDPGHHLVAFACEACDAATVTQACPLCDAPGPLRPRP